MPTDRLRETWARGGTALNAWLTLEGAASASTVAAAGFDSVTLDLQHGAAEPHDAARIFAAVEAAGAVPLARVRWNDPAELMRMLDVGARGIVCPMIGARTEAEAFVAACRYPPEGIRSYGPVHGALGAGREHVTRANEIVLTFAMIETAEGFGNLDEIASTPGLDGLYVGPSDLSLGLGLDTFADLRDPRLLEALDAVVDAAKRHEIVAGAHAPSPERSAALAERGFRFVTPAVDASLLADGATASIGRTRTLLGTGEDGRPGT
ncbi:MAG: aldolase/citrate lyase family protein, partial [Actinomycetota bacterium]